jgi:hypothetical protein
MSYDRHLSLFPEKNLPFLMHIYLFISFTLNKNDSRLKNRKSLPLSPVKKSPVRNGMIGEEP